ncbi:M12 family metallo-peptidase [bacterium]|nr:M12 family metallo-peptidase [bacterium]
MTFLKRISKLQLTRISLMAIFLSSLCFAVGWPQPLLADDAIMSAMGLKTGELITIDQDQAKKSEMAIKMNGQDYTVDYTFFSTRSNNFQLMVQQNNGEIVEQAAPPVTTIRGTLRGVEGSQVVGCIGEDGCCVKIDLPFGEKCYIEPVSPKMDNHPAFAGVHVVYTERDVIPSGAICGNGMNLAEAEEEAEAEAEQALASPSTASAVSSLQEVELSLDADFEYFTRFGSTEATLAQIELIINIVNDQYESEVGMRNTLSRVMIWTTEDDPYTSTDSGNLLNEFRLFYQRGSIKRPNINVDLCHLFTGKSLDGRTIGVAYLEAACSSFGYGLSQNVNRLSSMTDLVAHEMGHNWGAEHCNCRGNTMNPSLTGANNFNDTLTVPVITSFRDRVNCLNEIVPASLDDFVAGADITDSLREGVPIDFAQNIDATTEAGERDLVNVGSTVWFNAEADADGTISINTFGSDFDTQLHVYEIGLGGLAGLELIDNNNDSSGGSQSEVTFDVTEGTRYAIRVGGFRSSDSLGNGSEGNIVLNGEFSPAFLLFVTDIELNLGEGQRSAVGSVDVIFDGEVDVASEAVSVVQRSNLSGPTNQPVAASVFTRFDAVEDQTVATIQFDSQVRNSENILNDGNYVLTLNASGLTRNGVAMSEDFVFGDQESDGFYTLYGDSDGDRDVDNVDFSVFLQTYFKEEGVDDSYNSTMDFDADGDVDNVDFAAFLNRYFKTLPF